MSFCVRIFKNEKKYYSESIICCIGYVRYDGICEGMFNVL